MYKPSNPIRRNIVNKLLDWHPTQKWENDPMRDATILVTECQKLLPYVVVLNHRLTSLITVRDRDDVFTDCLAAALIPLGKNLRTWLFSCPHLQTSIKQVVTPAGEVIFNSKIRYGYLASGGHSPRILDHFELEYLVARHLWLRVKERTIRISELFNFIARWGDPSNVVSQRGRSKEDRYAFVSPTGKVLMYE